MNRFFTPTGACALFLGMCVSAIPASAHEELTQDEIQQYKTDGSYDERVARVRAREPYKLPEGNRQRALYKIRRAALEASGYSETQAARILSAGPQRAFPFTARPELRSSGTVRTLTILIDFKDRRAGTELPGMTPATFTNNIYGAGTAQAQAFVPHESVQRYYRRASEGIVDLQGTVLGWHQFPENRDKYNPKRAPTNLPADQRELVQARFDNAANFNLISTAMAAFDAAHDFSQYDNDNDGDIDLVTVLYAGPPTGWGSFWWAYRWEFFIADAQTKTFDGKRLRQFVFQFVDRRGPNGIDFDPTTLLHEMGHAFGLADYYDYFPGIGPDGGVGGLDMMHANQGNQNAFSRWLLDWIKPTIVGSGTPTVRQLSGSSSTQGANKAIAVFPGLTASAAPGEEMFIIENRPRVGNDAKMPGEGILVWHVDASVNQNASDFGNDNSQTQRKLVRLVRADNPADFNDGEDGTATTYFHNGGQFTPNSRPNSNGYDGLVTNIVVDQITLAGESASLRVGFEASGGPSPAAIAAAPARANNEKTNNALAATESVPVAEQVKSLTSVPPEAEIDLDELEALDRTFASSTAEELGAIWQQLQRKVPPGDGVTSSSLTLQLLLTHWASKNGEAAVTALLELPTDETFVQDTYPRLMRSWAYESPVAAASWYLAAENAGVRESTVLEAGSKFTRQVFESLYHQDRDQAIRGLEKLHHTSEVFGAVDGLRNASKQLASGPKALSEGLEEVENKADVIHAASHYFEALDAAKTAAIEIDDPVERAEFQSEAEATAY